MSRRRVPGRNANFLHDPEDAVVVHKCKFCPHEAPSFKALRQHVQSKHKAEWSRIRGGLSRERHADLRPSGRIADDVEQYPAPKLTEDDLY